VKQPAKWVGYQPTPLAGVKQPVRVGPRKGGAQPTLRASGVGQSGQSGQSGAPPH